VKSLWLKEGGPRRGTGAGHVHFYLCLVGGHQKRDRGRVEERKEGFALLFGENSGGKYAKVCLSQKNFVPGGEGSLKGKKGEPALNLETPGKEPSKGTFVKKGVQRCTCTGGREKKGVISFEKDKPRTEKRYLKGGAVWAKGPPKGTLIF